MGTAVVARPEEAGAKRRPAKGLATTAGFAPDGLLKRSSSSPSASPRSSFARMLSRSTAKLSMPPPPANFSKPVGRICSGSAWRGSTMLQASPCTYLVAITTRAGRSRFDASWGPSCPSSGPPSSNWLPTNWPPVSPSTGIANPSPPTRALTSPTSSGSRCPSPNPSAAGSAPGSANSGSTTPPFIPGGRPMTNRPCCSRSTTIPANISQGRNAQNTQDATIATDAPEPAKLWRESASATKSFRCPAPGAPPAPRR